MIRLSSMIGKPLLAPFAVGAAIVLGACSAAPPDSANGATNGRDQSVGTTEQAIVAGWGPITSDEYPPSSCGDGSVINGFRCFGDYCDNLQPSCSGAVFGASGSEAWTSLFSEEGVNYRICPTGSWAMGLQCTGDYCDNVAIQCYTPPTVVAQADCHYVGAISEESPGIFFPSGYYARGATCTGDYCDNMNFYVCRPCAPGQAACGSSCYNPAVQTCTGSPPILCPIGQKACNQACVPQSQVCNPPCPPGEVHCGGPAGICTDASDCFCRLHPNKCSGLP